MAEKRIPKEAFNGRPDGRRLVGKSVKRSEGSASRDARLQKLEKGGRRK